MQDIPDLKYKLGLFVGSEAIELERKDNQTWTPVQCPYVLHLFTMCAHQILCVYRDISPTSQVRVEILMKSGHLPWARKVQNVKEIGLQKLFNEYWTSKKHDLTLLGRSSSPTSLLTPDREAQRAFPWENILAISNYISLRALRFVSLEPSIASSS